MRREHKAFPERLLDQNLLLGGAGSQPALDGLDHALPGQEKKILFEDRVQIRRAQGVVLERLPLHHFLGVPRRQRVEHVVQVGVAHVRGLRLGRCRQHDEVLVAVAARLDLVRRTQQVHVDLEPEARQTAGLRTQIAVDLHDRLGQRQVVPGDGGVHLRLGLLPQRIDAGLR